MHEFCEPNPYKSSELTDQLFLLTANELITLGKFSFPGFKIGKKKNFRGKEKKSMKDHRAIKTTKFITAFFFFFKGAVFCSRAVIF